MAVTQVIEYKLESSRQLKQDGNFLVPADENTRYFQVVLDDPATPHSEIYAHASIPKRFNAHPDNDGVIVKKIDLKQGDDEESYIVDVTVEYNDDYSGEDPDDSENENPFDRPTIIRGGFAEYDEVMLFDINGVPVRNKAKDPFDPPLTRKAGAMRFSMTKNYPSLNMALLKQYKNAINSDTWFGQDAETVRIANITFDRNIESWRVDDDTTIKVVVWVHTFEFELAEEGFGSDGTWKRRELNQGFNHLVSGVLTPIYNTGGMELSKPKLLTSAGGVAANQDAYNWCDFDFYRPLPFAALGLV